MPAPASYPNFILVRHGDIFTSEKPLRWPDVRSHLALTAEEWEVVFSVKPASAVYGAISSNGSVLDVSE